MSPENSSLAQQPSKRTLILVGLLAMGAGFMVIALGAGWITTAPENFKAPRWVIIAAGLMFVFAGLSMLGPRSADSLIGAIVAAVMVSLFAAVGSWVAFGSGERHFTGTIGSGAARLSSNASEWSGRAVFGVGAILLLAMSAWAWWRCVQLLRQRKQSNR
jgi:prepilin signal peptidase PulO-like enzyme (type II secretory pathway)